MAEMRGKIPDDLFDPEIAARRDDVDTSHAAAASMIGLAPRHHHLILRVMHKGGLWSAQEIADAASIDYVAISRRMCELRRSGLIYRTEKKHLNRSGRSAYKYALGTYKEIKEWLR
jgi:predicted transcriptional regulator